MKRIVFLDIDGPIINTPMYFLDPMCSMQRTQMNTQAIAYVKRLCDISGAQLVINSTHSKFDLEDPLDGSMKTVKDHLIRFGMPASIFHERWKTDFPNWSNSRLKAINDWIEQEGEEIDWLCFDDVAFTPDRRLIVIDFDRGIDYAYYRKACKLWGFRKEPFRL